MSGSVRKQKSGDQLAPGDWLAPDQISDLAAEVLFAISYPGVGGTHVQLVAREQGKTVPFSDVVSGTTLFDLASDADLAELREAAQRAAGIADIRALADWLESHPWVPLPYSVDASEHLDERHVGGPPSPEAALAKLREVADRLGVKADESLHDRTKIEVGFGRTRYQLLAWHPDGRPAEPGPVPAVPNYGLGDEARTGTVVDESKHMPGCSCQPGTTVIRCRDEDADDSFRFGQHDHLPLHYSADGEAMACCGLTFAGLPRGHGYTTAWERVTCPEYLAVKPAGAE